MNIQLRRFGKDLEAYPPAVAPVSVFDIHELFTDGVHFNPEPEALTVRVCIYFDIGEDIKESYIKSEQDLEGWVIVHEGQRYLVGKARSTNSPLLRSIITPHEPLDANIDLSIGGHK